MSHLAVHHLAGRSSQDAARSSTLRTESGIITNHCRTLCTIRHAGFRVARWKDPGCAEHTRRRLCLNNQVARPTVRRAQVSTRMSQFIISQVAARMSEPEFHIFRPVYSDFQILVRLTHGDNHDNGPRSQMEGLQNGLVMTYVSPFVNFVRLEPGPILCKGPGHVQCKDQYQCATGFTKIIIHCRQN